MKNEEYRRALDVACREYEALLRRRASLDVRIAQLAQSIGSLTRLCGSAPTVQWGLTEACRMALKSAGYALTPLEVRARLEAMGVDMSRYRNNLAVIHTTLKRLTKSGAAKFVPRGYDEPGYQWVGMPSSPAKHRGGSDAASSGRRAKTPREQGPFP